MDNSDPLNTGDVVIEMNREIKQLSVVHSSLTMVDKLNEDVIQNSTSIDIDCSDQPRDEKMEI